MIVTNKNKIKKKIKKNLKDEYDLFFVISSLLAFHSNYLKKLVYLLNIISFKFYNSKNCF